MTLLDLFEQQVERTPDAVAVSFGTHSLTYRELDRRASRLAHALSAHGLGPESVVGVALPRSPQLLASLLAAWKTGAAYLPLDPSYPPARISLMLSDSSASLLLATGLLPAGVEASGLETLLLDGDGEAVEAESDEALPLRARPGNTAPRAPLGPSVTTSSLMPACSIAGKLHRSCPAVSEAFSSTLSEPSKASRSMTTGTTWASGRPSRGA